VIYPAARLANPFPFAAAIKLALIAGRLLEENFLLGDHLCYGKIGRCISESVEGKGEDG